MRLCERLALAVIVVGMTLLLGSALVGYVTPESREAQAERLRRTMDMYRMMGFAGDGR